MRSGFSFLTIKRKGTDYRTKRKILFVLTVGILLVKIRVFSLRCIASSSCLRIARSPVQTIKLAFLLGKSDRAILAAGG